MENQLQPDTEKIKKRKWDLFITFLSCGGFMLILIVMALVAIFIDNL